MQKRLIIAVILSVFIFIFFQQIQPPVERFPEEMIIERRDHIPVDDKMATKRTVDTIPTEKINDFARRNEETIRSENIELTVNSYDSGMNALLIRDKDGTMINLVNKDNSPFPLSLNLDRTGLWQLKKINESELLAVMEYEGIRISRKFSLSENIIRIENNIRNTLNIRQNVNIAMGWHEGLNTTEILKEENVRDNKIFAKLSDRVKRNIKEGFYEGEIKWAGILNRYFVVVFLEIDEIFNRFTVKKVDKKGYEYPSIELKGNIELAPYEGYQFTEKIYAGLKEFTTLRALNNDLSEIFAFGIFGFLSKLFLHILIWMNSFIGNYGWAIIIMTLFLQIFIIPLTAKSFKSMQAMKELQPKIVTLRSKLKNNPQRMNQEMMHLYKRHKVNPMGGCLPMILQMPIFISLYTMLRNAAELRHEPFLWVADLSRADMLFSAVPLLRDIPFIGNAGPLPFLMGGAMFLQQKFMGVGEGPQKSLTYIMPIIFTFLFMGFPSGLVLYWLSNSVFTFIVQYIMQRRRKINNK